MASHARVYHFGLRKEGAYCDEHGAACHTGQAGDVVAWRQKALVDAAGADRVLFELDSTTLTAQARAILRRQVRWLVENPEVAFTIEGHADEHGTRNYNLALGDRRATSVASFMSGLGISTSRLQTVSYGKERPEATGADEASFAQNRRAVSVVLSSVEF
ncbi:peptidoglycan-associated lipoprotein Pal [Sphingomonas paeninsulae]|uniref:peptidoglycan-associated lipoprotein Pal n=1 Tax=Sphingomonas paeninsulae TaxID=2319844 RepID=UPI0013CE9DAF|nr:peptidoglycan-associated lipoprotein Pal [Sphingomonas paeninsulae]